MNRKLAVCLAATSVVALLVGTAQTASAAVTVIVNQAAPGGCSNVAEPFCTVQEGVGASGPGDTVQVEPGTYVEQVTIGSGMDGLKLRAIGAVTIKAPPDPLTAPGAIVRVTGSRSVLVRGFTITGPGGLACSTLDSGIRVDGDGKVFIRHDHVTAIRDSTVSGCQNGVAIRVGRTPDATSGDAVITDTQIDDYQKGGVSVQFPGSSAFLRRVSITGQGPTAATAANGLQVSSGAEATVRDVQISGNVFTSEPPQSTGVLLFNPAFVSLQNVTSSDNDIDFAIIGALDPKVVGSTATGATFQGFAVDETSSGGIYKYLTATGNGNGIGAGSPEIEDDSTGTGTAGTANDWWKNVCDLSIPDGLCPGVGPPR